MRAFGIEYDSKPDNCCYVLVKLMKVHKSVQLDSLENVTVREYVKRAIDKLNVSDTSEIRRFMKSYGTHYIDSYVTGNFIYQVSFILLFVTKKLRNNCTQIVKKTIK